MLRSARPPPARRACGRTATDTATALRIGARPQPPTRLSRARGSATPFLPRALPLGGGDAAATGLNAIVELATASSSAAAAAAASRALDEPPAAPADVTIGHILPWFFVAAVGVGALAMAVTAFAGAKESIASIENGRKRTASKQSERKKLARKLWGLSEEEEEEAGRRGGA